MPGDFDCCRFDFRIDSKKGLMPSRRKGRSSGRGVVEMNASSCSTLYSCKQCGLLVNNRQSLIEHKLSHRSVHLSPVTTDSQREILSSLLPSTSAVNETAEGDASSSFSETTIPLISSPATPYPMSGNVLWQAAPSGGDKSQSVIQRYISQLSQSSVKPVPFGQTNATQKLSLDINVIVSHDKCLNEKQLKSRQLNETVERLWKQKLTSLLTNSVPLTSVNCCEDQASSVVFKSDQQLMVRRITAAPGTQPQFYTSLMRFQSSRRKVKERPQNRKLLTFKKRPSKGDTVKSVNDPHLLTVHSPNGTADSHHQATCTNTDGTVPLTPSLPLDSSVFTCQFICDFNGCRRMFRELKHLKVHRLQHTNERPLACSLCSYTCRQRNSLNWHMKSRHGLNKHVTSDGRTVYG